MNWPRGSINSDRSVTAEEWIITEPIVDDLDARVQRLVNVGVGYLTLDRSSPSLSAGEAQRLRLASLLGSGLTGVLYVLDEPTIGLHPRDNARLIDVLRQLRDLGNTVLIIEHDLDMLRAADFVVDVGPGARSRWRTHRRRGHARSGGRDRRIDHGAISLRPIAHRHPHGTSIGQRQASDDSRRARQQLEERHRRGAAGQVGCGDGRIGIGQIVVDAGHSRSGGAAALLRRDRSAGRARYDRGWDFVDKIITIDQSAIGRSTRSNAATYTDAFTGIREAFASTPEAKVSII